MQHYKSFLSYVVGVLTMHVKVHVKTPSTRIGRKVGPNVEIIIVALLKNSFVNLEVMKEGLVKVDM